MFEINELYKQYEHNFNLEDNFDFSNFRERYDVFGDLLPRMPFEWNYFSHAYFQDRKLFNRYLGIPKTKDGYGNKEHLHIDGHDCMHIFQSTFIFSECKNLKSIVEIGGGFGNIYRLNNSVIDYHKWYSIDLPFVLELQKWYLDKENVDLNKIEFISAYEYEELMNIDLCIASHSLSSLPWDDFISYYNNIVKNSKYFFYAGNYLDHFDHSQKMKKIESNFEKIKNHNELYLNDNFDEYGVYLTLFKNKYKD